MERLLLKKKIRIYVHNTQQKLRKYLISKLDNSDEELSEIAKNYKAEISQCDTRQLEKEAYLMTVFTKTNKIMREVLITEPFPCQDHVYPNGSFVTDTPMPRHDLFFGIHHRVWKEVVVPKKEELLQINLKERGEIHAKFNPLIAEVRNMKLLLEEASIRTLLLLWFSKRWDVRR